MSFLITFLALTFEAQMGYSNRLFRAIGHPVTWIGRVISFLDLRLNRATDSDRSRRLCGILALLVIVGVPAAIAFGLQYFLASGWVGLFIVIMLGSTLLAQRSLADHVGAVATALDAGGLEAGRSAVSMVVGRDPESLDEAGVSRAAIESLAENFSDGVVAPAFWLAAGGLASGVAYKAANTADSMIGHRTSRHEAFGWAAARFDDLINLPASRITAFLIIIAAVVLPGMNATEAWRAVWRDARRHRSPNAGWPEAAMAGALGLALAGPRSYGGVQVDDAVMGSSGRREANSQDIRRALKLFWVADALLMAVLGLLAIAFVA